MIQKYTEFFNELGTLIDQGQKNPEKIYIFSANFVDFDSLPRTDGVQKAANLPP